MQAWGLLVFMARARSQWPGQAARSSIAIVVCLSVSASPSSALAHEYWLEPLARDWQVGATVQADIRNGENLTGAPLPFLPDQLTRAGMISDNHRQALTGRLGDYPAFQLPAREPGLHLLLLESSRRELVHEDYANFDAFLNYHGLQHMAQEHAQRELPRKFIIEHYFRYCKAIVDVIDSADSASITASSSSSSSSGSSNSNQSNSSTEIGSGNDPSPALAAQGQRLELLALTNPLDTDRLELQLLFEGKPLAQRQVELFHRQNDKTVTRMIAMTDSNGRAGFSTVSDGQYLANSVHLLAPDSADAQAHWMTLWASLAFRKQP